MPVWATAFAFVFLGKRPDRGDVQAGAACIAGVLLCVEPWAPGADSKNVVAGAACALGFAVVNGAAAVLVNAKLRDEAALFMVSGALGAALSASVALLGVRGDLKTLKLPPAWAALFMLVACGPLMSGQMGLRVRGLRLAKDPAVTVVVYVEIAFAFLWDVTIIGRRPSPSQCAGALLVVLGSTSAVALRWRARRRAAAESPPCS